MLSRLFAKWNDIKLKNKLLIAFVFLIAIPMSFIFVFSYTSLRNSTLKKFNSKVILLN
ncbi:hypothetical protein [Caldicellulosiruptor morganii]|uniref:hypothetical protein n=1 Tax=Caldicellulosiruptor morganii TaxID=1387555 RepID=UPI000A8D60CB|nr:hypothetical protein [Caldicellulosiruptor morganii]